ncbi:MAG: YcjF family protein [Methylobacter sp.]
MSENTLAVNDKTEEAHDIVQTSMYYAIAAGIVPIPMFDFLAVTGIQLDMLRRLSNLYGVEFMQNKGKNIIGALTGGGFSSSLSPMLASTIKVIPFVGSTLGAVSMPVIAGASTYAVGKVFIQHFESGGTFLTFDPKAVREFYAEQLKEGNAIAAARSTSKPAG